MIESPGKPWIAGQLALSLLSIDPASLGGLHLRARACPVRDRVMAGVTKGIRIAPTISDIDLFGGVDIAATLTAGHVITTQGVLGHGGPLILTMAERCSAELAARLGQLLDSGDGTCLITLDEGADADEIAPSSLRERLAFSLDLDGVRHVDVAEPAFGEQDLEQARARLNGIAIPDDVLDTLTRIAFGFGIDSLRAPWLAACAARAHAALAGRDALCHDDIQIAAQLVFTSRATRIPEPPEQEQETSEPEQNTQDDAQGPDDQTLADIPEDMLVDAVKALLPPELLIALMHKGKSRGPSGGSGAGKARKGNRRGRPLPSRPGKAGSASRIDLVATLRAAAPWQPLRRKAQPDRSGVLIRPSDIRVRKFEEKSDRLVIFAVDASGSAAVARLAEAKGAVELMLAEAYARRDHVALIAFRGETADIILPPTRSLVQTKRRLSGLPGGGGTPLAAGLQITADLAERAQSQGLAPALAVLTDGRANVPFPGRSGRIAAAEDAEKMAIRIRAMNLPAALVDTSARPHGALHGLAVRMGATYVPLPRADAAALSTAIGAAITP